MSVFDLQQIFETVWNHARTLYIIIVTYLLIEGIGYQRALQGTCCFSWANASSASTLLSRLLLSKRIVVALCSELLSIRLAVLSIPIQINVTLIAEYMQGSTSPQEWEPICMNETDGRISCYKNC